MDDDGGGGDRLSDSGLEAKTAAFRSSSCLSRMKEADLHHMYAYVEGLVGRHFFELMRKSMANLPGTVVVRFR